MSSVSVLSASSALGTQKSSSQALASHPPSSSESDDDDFATTGIPDPALHKQLQSQDWSAPLADVNYPFFSKVGAYYSTNVFSARDKELPSCQQNQLFLGPPQDDVEGCVLDPNVEPARQYIPKKRPASFSAPAPAPSDAHHDPREFQNDASGLAPAGL
ncbi:uncharacterized protein BJ171DRAFT_584636 [Polychytrium aggregatum]|uniref:uncharacterized protein n=1 Tax=Polychytrium aggregatum TaxID=110093 RepID=UPI0022FE0F70|nr:uncharacterized protein BJ171DRAFT_584636 [Polychytrium aggregatum]KAI9201989.1 hypothetical protein BJ171DRAFT_584636 [Polychytrium aggregatum]